MYDHELNVCSANRRIRDYEKIRKDENNRKYCLLRKHGQWPSYDHSWSFRVVSETKLTERQQKKLNLIKESPTITGKQMAETLSVSQRAIERDLSALQKKGFIKHEGKDNDGRWIIM